MISKEDLHEEFQIEAVSNKGTEAQFIIPQRFRKMENLHILFWLVKDISWCMIWRPLGIMMVFPTLLVAIIITIRTRRYFSELCHNTAVVLWIIANSYWMISEFFVFDSRPLALYNFSFRDLTVIPFSLGIIVLGYYYLWWKPRHRDLVETM